MEILSGKKNLIVFFFVWVVCAFLALHIGVTEHLDWDLIVKLRLPRVLLASALGLGLAVSGAVLQTIFSNPLCEPYTLGISSGAALGAVIGSTFGLMWNPGGLFVSGFMGSMVFAAILVTIAKKVTGKTTPLLLGGVMLSLLGSSLVALWMAIADPNGVYGAVIWLLGDLSRARLYGSIAVMASLIFLTLVLTSWWRQLDAFLLGDENALSLGVDVQAVRNKAILVTSVIIALCVSSGGIIGFVGLVVPHFVRKFTGSLHFRLIPNCAVWGAITLTLADVLSRMIHQPYEIPVGVITALLGIPIFLFLILETKKRLWI
jgi:iron complex transport system permease protein